MEMSLQFGNFCAGFPTPPLTIFTPLYRPMVQRGNMEHFLVLLSLLCFFLFFFNKKLLISVLGSHTPDTSLPLQAAQCAVMPCYKLIAGSNYIVRQLSAL